MLRVLSSVSGFVGWKFPFQGVRGECERGLVFRVLCCELRVLHYVMVAESFEFRAWRVGAVPIGRNCVRDSSLICLI